MSVAPNIVIQPSEILRNSRDPATGEELRAGRFLCVTPLRSRIGVVLKPRAEPEVRRVHARRIVSTRTVVTDVHPLRDGTVVEFIREPVRSNLPKVEAHAAIATGPQATGPEPTVGSLALRHVSPEAFLGRAKASEVFAGARTIAATSLPLEQVAQWEELAATPGADSGRCATVLIHRSYSYGVTARDCSSSRLATLLRAAIVAQWGPPHV
jgi:hypothetical protein